MRTHTNGELTLKQVGLEVQLVGWVAKRRNFGSIVFIDLRDRYGITQVVFNEEMASVIKEVRNEYILHVTGTVAERKDKNPKLATGDIEVIATEVSIVNTAETTPMIIADETDALEDTRLKYRYLDMRRPVVQNKFIERHNIVKSIRRFLEDRDFIEVETPILTKSTPEGARDYLVPSRVHPGEFYALPQSPQLFKQLLMISGMERYYQIARCFRDEDLRADRQMEFTQVDIETSFLTEKEIQTMMEEMMQVVMKEVKGIDLQLPLLKLTYEDAMNRYGSDKPDIRYSLEFQDITALFEKSSFQVFESAIQSSGVIKAIVVENKASATRKEIDAYTDEAKKNGAKGLVALKYLNGILEGSAVKFFTEEEVTNLVTTCKLKENDLILIAAGAWESTCNALGAVRSFVAKKEGLYSNEDYKFLWVVDFPLLEYSEEDGRYYAKHHPFTRPKDEDLEYLDSDPSKVKAYAYDLVLNGFELGGGSLRIYNREMQQKMFELLGFTEEEIKERFGFFVDAFQYGTPPHGGVAFGLDRIAMILTQSDSLRDVIAFPKNANAVCPVSNAPGVVDKKQLDELHLEIKSEK